MSKNSASGTAWRDGLSVSQPDHELLSSLPTDRRERYTSVYVIIINT